MKKTLNTLLLLCFTMAGFAQAPQGIPYQTVLRHTNGSLILNQNVALRFSIHDSVANGTVLYQETQMSPTNGLGLVTVTIGQGTAVGAAFTGINWGHNNKFLQIELDASGGTTYTDLGTTQMMSVPFALYSNATGELKQTGSNSQTMLYTTDGF